MKTATARIAIFAGVVDLLALVIGPRLAAQKASAAPPDAKIWRGVFTAAQAERGKARFQSSCANCHNFDLKGSTRGPALTGDAFMTNWDTQDLANLFHKIQGSMPKTNPSTLPEDAYLDLVAYILQTNTFPEGPAELTAAAFDGVQIVRAGAVATARVANFAMVELVGCLAPGPGPTWMLSDTSAPIASKDLPATVDELRAAEARPRGGAPFRLVSVRPFKPEALSGQTVAVKGLLYQFPHDNRLNVTALQPVNTPCP